MSTIAHSVVMGLPASLLAAAYRGTICTSFCHVWYSISLLMSVCTAKVCAVGSTMGGEREREGAEKKKKEERRGQECYGRRDALNIAVTSTVPPRSTYTGRPSLSRHAK